MPILEELNSFKDAVSGCRPTFAREDEKRTLAKVQRRKHAKRENKNILAEARRRGDADTRRRKGEEGRSETKNAS